MDRDERDVARWQEGIRSKPTYNPATLKVIAEGLRKLIHDYHIGRPHVRTSIDLERLGMEFLCDAIKSGAFAGDEWYSWRITLADSPHIGNALILLSDHGPTEFRRPPFPPNAKFSELAPNIFASLIERFISETANVASPKPTPAQIDMPAQDSLTGDHQEEVLQALLELKAFDSKSKKTTPEICRVALGPSADPGVLKRPIADLKRAGYIATKEGRGGGAWLSQTGRDKATEIRAKL